jgi:hypothetical protein
VTAVDIFGNEIKNGTSWGHAGYYPQNPEQIDLDEEEDPDLLGWALFALTLLIILGGASYVGFIILGRRKFSITEDDWMEE